MPIRLLLPQAELSNSLMSSDEANIDSIVATALDNDISALTIRCGLDAALQPRLQGSIDDNCATDKVAEGVFDTTYNLKSSPSLCPISSEF